MSDNSLHTKYRPKKFADVVGQDATVKSLIKVIDDDTSHAFLLTGPSGCGKTTLARIAALRLGCKDHDIMEIDAADSTGVDAMRAVKQQLHYVPMGDSETRVVIVDECHMLSKASWNSLLKILEEPPSHVYWFLCTTEPGKVPATVKTRTTSYTLKSLNEKGIEVVVDRAMEAEGIELEDAVKDMVIREAYGSPRQALVNLASVNGVTSRKEAAELLKAASASDPVREFCQFLLKGGSWSAAMSLVSKMEDEQPESVRIIVCAYMGSVAKNAKSDKQAIAVLRILEAFSESYNQSEKWAPLMLSVGRVLYAG